MRRLAILVDEPLPSLEQERADPEAADRCYDRVTRRLIGLTRDPGRFPLVLAENINYGQRRNLLGLRRFGLVAAMLTLIVALGLLVSSGGHPSGRLAQFAPSALIALLALVFWSITVNADWVRVPADAYAERLFEAADMLARDERLRVTNDGR